jgi:hypothetical protein
VEFLEREYARFDGDSYLEAGSVSRRAALSVDRCSLYYGG